MVKVESPAQAYHFKPGAHHDHRKKRIIACCDGTWMDSDGSYQTPSNVTRIVRAIPAVGHDHSTEPATPIAQVTYYHNGIGTGPPSLWNKYVGGATGEGMSLCIREVYSFICLNYNPGDEIFLLGFSRGAFTARSVSTLIRAMGLLTPHGLRYNIQLLEDWEFQEKPGWRSSYDEPWSNRPKVNTPEYQRKLLELELTRPNIPIKCVAVWDTVGSLGVPAIGLLPQAQSDFAFVDTKVEPNIEYAFHALALDERRASFQPTIWEKPSGQEWPAVLKQTWFPGVHSDVGGSYPDDDLADITLTWMVGQLDHYNLLSFNHDYIMRSARISIDRALHDEQKVRDWGLGKIHDSMTWFFRLARPVKRTPKEYFATGREAAHRSQPRRLENTNERVHASVRIRMGKNGAGCNDQGKYDSLAMVGWTMNGVETDPDTPIALGMPGDPGKMTSVTWKKTVTTNAGAKDEQAEELEMPEDDFTHFERLVLRLWPDLEREFDYVKPGSHQMNLQKGNTFPTELRLKKIGESDDDNNDDGSSRRSSLEGKAAAAAAGIGLVDAGATHTTIEPATMTTNSKDFAPADNEINPTNLEHQHHQHHQPHQPVRMETI